MATMKLIGARELEDSLNELPKRLAKNTLTRALLRAGQPMADNAKQRIDRHPPAPDTKDKIVVSKTLSRRQRRGYDTQTYTETEIRRADAGQRAHGVHRRPAVAGGAPH